MTDDANDPNDTKLINRYQTAAAALWGMFNGDPLPDSDPSHFWIERLEALIARRMLAPAVAPDEDLATAERIAELEGLADDLAAQRDTYRHNNLSLVEQACQLRRERNAAASAASSGFWVWSDTDPNDLESLCEDALVSLTAGQLRALLGVQREAPPNPDDPRLDGMASSERGLKLCPALALAERADVMRRFQTPWRAGIGGDDGKTGFIDDACGRPIDFDDAAVCRHVARLVNGNAAGVVATKQQSLREKRIAARKAGYRKYKKKAAGQNELTEPTPADAARRAGRGDTK